MVRRVGGGGTATKSRGEREHHCLWLQPGPEQRQRLRFGCSRWLRRSLWKQRNQNRTPLPGRARGLQDPAPIRAGPGQPVVPALLDRPAIVRELVLLVFRNGRDGGGSGPPPALRICRGEHLRSPAALAAVQRPRAHARWFCLFVGIRGLAVALHGGLFAVVAHGVRDGIPERGIQRRDGGALASGVAGTPPGPHDDAALVLDGRLGGHEKHPQEDTGQQGLQLSQPGRRARIGAGQDVVETADAPIAQQDGANSADDAVLLHHGNGTDGNLDGAQVSLYAATRIQKGNEGTGRVEGASPGRRRRRPRGGGRHCGCGNGSGQCLAPDSQPHLVLFVHDEQLHHRTVLGVLRQRPRKLRCPVGNHDGNGSLVCPDERRRVQHLDEHVLSTAPFVQWRADGGGKHPVRRGLLAAVHGHVPGGPVH
mmetsp:Transcript_12646/g.29607  ORF Transcript_12646/g.29607 Transcript_12646/m.29607 type:complete len:423 (-) Transcript_12646:1383-2651(-)